MYQSGFRTNYSIILCLAQLIDIVASGMDKQMHTGMILVGLQKAFDTLDHGVLLEKMNGVPQGSILGRLLFLLHVNDLPESLSDAGSYLYADDTCIFYQHEDVKKMF